MAPFQITNVEKQRQLAPYLVRLNDGDNMPRAPNVHISVRSHCNLHRRGCKIRCIPAESTSIPHRTSVREQHMDHSKFLNHKAGRRYAPILVIRKLLCYTVSAWSRRLVSSFARPSRSQLLESAQLLPKTEPIRFTPCSLSHSG